MKFLGCIIIICLVSSTLATYGLYALVPSSYASGYSYPHSHSLEHSHPAHYRYAVPVGYTHSVPATNTFVKYIEPDTFDYPVYALGHDHYDHDHHKK